MATYKVLQDIEAEDKLIGPFGIRQFIYLIIVAVSLFIGFRLAVVSPVLAIPLLPHTLFFGLLALPFGGEQPTETWLLAKIRFAIKPRVRIWDQSGAKQLVTITAPKKIERILTKNMSEREVRSRLEALANTIDSRGWVVKHVNINVFSQPALAGSGGGSDRLLDISSPVAQTPIVNVTASDDILDEQNNPTAQNLDRMINASSKAHRDQAVSNMRPSPAAQPQQPDPQWFLTPSNDTSTAGSPYPAPQPAAAAAPANLVMPDPTAVAQPQGLPLQPVGQQATGPLTEDQLLAKIHAEKQHAPKNYGNMRVIKTLEEQQAEAAAIAAATPALPNNPPVTRTPNPDILELANNDDLNVATLARQANKKPKEQSSDGEVVINLH